MRSQFVVSVLLALCLVSAAALAANDKVEATFESLSASGVTGDAVLKPLPAGETLIHASIRGLEPGAEYTSRLFDTSQTCDVAAPGEVIVTFVANPAGMAQWNERVDREISSIGSISVQLVTDNSVKACAGIQ